MLKNATQLYLLDSFIGNEGNYFETIKDAQDIDLGTKVLYLQRAITQDCQTFLQSLDKLYLPALVDEAEAAHLELIRSFKAINDMFFNNEVKFGETGVAPARERYFHNLGDIDNDDFIESINTMINERIKELRENNNDEVTTQIAAREAAEANLVPQSGWRLKVDLPLAQLPQHVARPVTYLQRQIPVPPIDVTDVNQLASDVHIPAADLLALEQPLLQLLLNNSFSFNHLVNEVHIPAADLLALEQPLLQLLLNNSFSFNHLVNEVHIPAADLLALEQPLLQLLLNRPLSFKHLVNVVDNPATDLLALEQPLLQLLLNSALSFVRLVNEVHIRATDLLALEQPLLQLLLDRSPNLSNLVSVQKIPFARLVELPRPQLESVLNNFNSDESQSILITLHSRGPSQSPF